MSQMKKTQCWAFGEHQGISLTPSGIASSFECRALKKVRDEMGLTNVEIMVPLFVWTVGEARQVVDLFAQNGLKAEAKWPKSDHDVRAFLEHAARGGVLESFDGFSIGF